ncbi:hypothetical protein J2T22_004273 [Pseudarthrobacter defluvii]|uniref:Uncharacterized protein n=1 Tax=Pseudarthrobacter defluvii TaxID=410837 RepID=A0ABT9UQ15_9MICC|nr:hypothetical protein [Pseudarthrobacter defluvii]
MATHGPCETEGPGPQYSRQNLHFRDKGHHRREQVLQRPVPLSGPPIT